MRKRHTPIWIGLLVVLLPTMLGLVPGCATWSDGPVILNVSYDSTRELYRQLDRAFVADYLSRTGQKVRVRQSHGGSGSQARAVMDGIPADIVSLAIWPDTQALVQRGLIDGAWEDRLPNHAVPFFSTIVFVVRKGNPKKIHDWQDLQNDNLKIICANPKISGGAKLITLAAWGSVLKRQQITDSAPEAVRRAAEADAEKFVTRLYRQVPVLDSGSRSATITFSHRLLGDVHLTWESEALLEVEEFPHELEIVYPSCSIMAEPKVALVDRNVAEHGTRAIAERYLEFLYSNQAQEIIAQNGYRPTIAAVQESCAHKFPPIDLFRIDYAVPGGWVSANQKFFAEGALFDRIMEQAH